MAPPFRTANQQQQRALPDLYPDSQMILPHEDLENYTAGGFHPVNLGDTFRGGRYTVRHKLGYGGYSTVWLAHDKDARQWVSIKVKSAATSTEELHLDPEISNFQQLEKRYAESAQTTPYPLVRLLDCFRHTGPNGTHNCLVMELLGPSLSDILECYEYRDQTFRPDTVLRASCQLLDGLAFVHQAGFAHGDMSNGNVAFTCKNAMESEEDLFYATGDPVTSAYSNAHIPWSPELPKHLVQYTSWPGWYEDPEDDFRLLDLGLAFPIGSPVTSISQPRDVRSPETFFIGSFDYQHDQWRAGCVIYSLYYQKWPFMSFREDDAIFIRRLVMKLGPLPDEWQSRWEDMQRQSQRQWDEECQRPREPPITETFQPRRNAIISSCNDEDGEYEKDEYTERDYAALDCLLWVLKGLFQYQPDKRLSPQEAASYIRSKWTDYRRESEPERPRLEEGS